MLFIVSVQGDWKHSGLNVCVLVSQPGVRNAEEILSCAWLFW